MLYNITDQNLLSSHTTTLPFYFYIEKEEYPDGTRPDGTEGICIDCDKNDDEQGTPPARLSSKKSSQAQWSVRRGRSGRSERFMVSAGIAYDEDSERGEGNPFDPVPDDPDESTTACNGLCNNPLNLGDGGCNCGNL